MRGKIVCGFVVAACAVLAGCESVPKSSYGPSAASERGFGYSQSRISDDCYEVVFRGHGGMDYDRARGYAVLRAAEIGRELGYTHFTIEGERNATETEEFSYSLPMQRTSYIGPYMTPVTTYDDIDLSETVRFHRPILRVRYYEGPPEGRHLEVYEVSRAIEDLCSRYKVTLPADQPR